MEEEKKNATQPQNGNVETSKENAGAKAKTKPMTPAEEAEKKRKLKETERFKQKYFEFYDDVKISHREDW